MIHRFVWIGLAVGLGGCTWWLWPSRRNFEIQRVRTALQSDRVEVMDLRLEGPRGITSRMVAVFLDPRATSPRIVLNPERRSLERLAADADVIVNAGFFTPEFAPTGLLLSQGEVLHPFVGHGGGAGTGVLAIRNGQVELHRREDYRVGDPRLTTLAIQAGPRLIEGGGLPGIRSDDGLAANRTVIGRDGRGWLAVVAIQAESPRGAPSLFELMRLLGPDGLGSLRPELALDAALNLDGGPSTGLQVRLPGASMHLPEGAAVASALALEIDR